MVTNPKTVKDNLQVELGPDNQRKRVTNLFLLSLIRKQDNKTKTTRQVLPHAVEVNRPQQHMVNLSFQSNDKTTGSEQSKSQGKELIKAVLPQSMYRNISFMTDQKHPYQAGYQLSLPHSQDFAKALPAPSSTIVLSLKSCNRKLQSE